MRLRRRAGLAQAPTRGALTRDRAMSPMLTSTDSKPPRPTAGARAEMLQLRDLAPDPREG